jgi:hypothetical protein
MDEDVEDRPKKSKGEERGMKWLGESERRKLRFVRVV